MAADRSKDELYELERTKKAIGELRTIIAGAKGEFAVEQELKKLPNNFYVINDYRLNFTRPMINKQTGEKIFYTNRSPCRFAGGSIHPGNQELEPEIH